ncbi:hypothetical protein AC249_AIPGENE7053 [Exaiptasia diaphana]|nr:hypothetical protein AC249_AIPGENE7053 [Exaiptasia diaphana]
MRGQKQEDGVKFLEHTRRNWKATKLSAVCSEHFIQSDYQSAFLFDIPNSKNFIRLKKDDFGITAYSTQKSTDVATQRRLPSSQTLRKKKKERDALLRQSLDPGVNISLQIDEQVDEGNIAEDEENPVVFSEETEDSQATNVLQVTSLSFESNVFDKEPNEKVSFVLCWRA